jgi:hypothetical protein
MSVELYRPPKPEERQKNLKFFTEKTISYPRFEPRTSGLAVGSINHCTIGSVVQMHHTTNRFCPPVSPLKPPSERTYTDNE